jgi:hypothetical protein
MWVVNKLFICFHLDIQPTIPVAPGLPQRFWLRSVAPLQLPRYRRMQPANQYPQDLRDEYQRYIQIMNNLKQGEFGPLLTNQLKLVKVRALPKSTT